MSDISDENKEVITAPTFCFLFNEKKGIETLRKEKKILSNKISDELKQFIFNKCMDPIKKGIDSGDYDNFDEFYGPLITILNANSLKTLNLNNAVRYIFSTNWDLCFKKISLKVPFSNP